MRRTVPVLLGFAALVLSPQAACTHDDGGLSAAQVTALRESVEGTWEYKDGSTTIQFRVTQSSRDFDPDNPHASLVSLGTDAYACGNHGLVKPASACIDVYHMPLDVEITTGTAPDSRGVLTSYGGGTSGNELWLSLGATEVRGTLANETLTIEGSSTKTLRRIAR